MGKVGVFGGTFNPPHLAHLLAAETVRDHLRLDKVLFVPASIPPHKMGELIISGEHRAKMVELSIRDNPFFELCTMELERPGPSYTVDTLRELHEKFPGEELYLIVGVDLLIDFEKWKDHEIILKLSKVVGMNRPGFDMAMVDKEFLHHIELVNVPQVDISSTSIRRRIQSGHSIKYLVPLEVENYINNHL
ncbi:MAG: nicotinate-nucleotide adenylyltransferase, partial [Candidatus Kryptoniota bacterium]